MEAKIYAYETLVSIYQSTLRHMKKDPKLQLSIFGRLYFAMRNGKVPAFSLSIFMDLYLFSPIKYGRRTK